MQVAFISNGEVEFSSTFGTKKNYWFSSEKANDETLFQAASLSKPISAIICMILVQKEVLDLDKDVKEYLQGSSLEFDGITLRQLLSHTASIGVGGYVGYGINVELKTTLEIAQEVKENANVNRGDFSYSGGGYQVMQFILVHVTKKPFEHLAVELLFKPLA
jgi:CubicO group peptidase (beta-lactamase class C family)